jgi:hypothetical protein
VSVGWSLFPFLYWKNFSTNQNDACDSKHLYKYPFRWLQREKKEGERSEKEAERDGRGRLSTVLLSYIRYVRSFDVQIILSSAIACSVSLFSPNTLFSSFNLSRKEI